MDVCVDRIRSDNFFDLEVSNEAAYQKHGQEGELSVCLSSCLLAGSKNGLFLCFFHIADDFKMNKCYILAINIDEYFLLIVQSVFERL